MVALLLALAEVEQLVAPTTEALTVDPLRQGQEEAVGSHGQSLATASPTRLWGRLGDGAIDDFDAVAAVRAAERLRDLVSAP